MIGAERRYRITGYIRKHRAASIADLAGKFQVHETTIRRDLKILEQEGVLKRTYGGAILTGVKK